MEDPEEEEQKVQPTANGSAVPKAPAPEAAEATAMTMSIADQIAFGKRNVASLFQVNDLLLLLAVASWLQRCPCVLVMSSAFAFVLLPCQWW